MYKAALIGFIYQLSNTNRFNCLLIRVYTYVLLVIQSLYYIALGRFDPRLFKGNHYENIIFKLTNWGAFQF